MFFGCAPAHNHQLLLVNVTTSIFLCWLELLSIIGLFVFMLWTSCVALQLQSGFVPSFRASFIIPGIFSLHCIFGFALFCNVLFISILWYFVLFCFAFFDVLLTSESSQPAWMDVFCILTFWVFGRVITSYPSFPAGMVHMIIIFMCVSWIWLFTFNNKLP